MDSRTSAGRYAVPPPGNALASWGANSSVFNRRTGETHLLSVLPAEILVILAEQPMAFDQLCARTAELCGVCGSPEWDRKIRAMLDELLQLELVEQCSP